MLRAFLIASLLFLISSLIEAEESYSVKNTKSSDLFSMFLTALKDLPVCKSFSLCQLVGRLGTISENTLSQSIDNTIEYQERSRKSSSSQARSYYSGYGAAPAAPTYYPTFDPISILASLAFLAFLLQSFASLFDRSRSIIPTIVSSRGSGSSQVPDVPTRILRALDEYEAINKNSITDSNDDNDRIPYS
ncbi:uncharacterized protein LOC107267981 [Cephus cinctus]|uniref:Uncharacterized protein LOC107267981 n=1 Tax=Cephus cinctus TaxID=211228 RepID=A0AAJ7FK38_CEPCN|nr:uncharacterized protein LOC107267981 [Cephus cinctus]